MVVVHGAPKCLKRNRRAFTETPRLLLRGVLLPGDVSPPCDMHSLDCPARQRRRCRHAWITRLGFDSSLVAWVSRISRKRRYDSHPSRCGCSASRFASHQGQYQNSIGWSPGAPIGEGQHCQGRSPFLCLLLPVWFGPKMSMKQIPEKQGSGYLSTPQNQKERTS